MYFLLFIYVFKNRANATCALYSPENTVNTSVYYTRTRNVMFLMQNAFQNSTCILK